MGINKYSVVESNNLSLGQVGFDVISDTSANTGKWVAIKAASGVDAVVSAAVTTDGDDLSSYTIAENDTIYGNFTSITLTSGTVLAYRG